MRALAYGTAFGALLGLVFGWLIAGCAAVGMTFGHFTAFWQILLVLWGAIVLLSAGLGAAVGYAVGRFGDD